MQHPSIHPAISRGLLYRSPSLSRGREAKNQKTKRNKKSALVQGPVSINRLGLDPQSSTALGPLGQ